MPVMKDVSGQLSFKVFPGVMVAVDSLGVDVIENWLVMRGVDGLLNWVAPWGCGLVTGGSRNRN